MRPARRIEELPPYLFATLDRKIAEARARGVDVISLAIGDPDHPTPSHIVQAGVKAMQDPSTHHYPSYYGMGEFRRAVAAYYRRRFSVELDPDAQVLPLIGSKEGIAHLATAYVDPGDCMLTCDPGYPVYAMSAILSGGRAVPVPLRAADGFLPRLAEIDHRVASDSKILWLNYPGNPTGAVSGADTFAEAVEFCRDHDILLAHDAAYAEITYDGYRAPSVLEVPGAFEVALEFGSLSKTYNMTGWRVGWAAGSEEAVEALGRVKTNIDSGIFNALQLAGIAALEGPQDGVSAMIEIYRRRRDAVLETLDLAGWSLQAPKGAIYVWVPVPDGDTSATFTEFLLSAAGVLVAPGSGYGSWGEGYVRFSLTIEDARLEEGLERISRALEQR
ncbi:MAG: LL-diaminopimelate aminotransferase [Actinomycetota bacterium]